MRDAFVSVVAATLVSLFSMTAAAETPAPRRSGIEGTIIVSPIRPGPSRIGEASAAPVPDTPFVVKAGEAVVARFTTDGEGRFQVALPPGHYVILRDGGAMKIGRWRFEAEVVAGQMTAVHWTADTGLRLESRGRQVLLISAARPMKQREGKDRVEGCIT